jgi:hypothetical protein
LRKYSQEKKWYLSWKIYWFLKKDESSGSDKEKDSIDDDESDAEEEDLKRNKNGSSEMNDEVGDEALIDLKTKKAEEILI